MGVFFVLWAGFQLLEKRGSSADIQSKRKTTGASLSSPLHKDHSLEGAKSVCENENHDESVDSFSRIWCAWSKQEVEAP